VTGLALVFAALLLLAGCGDEGPSPAAHGEPTYPNRRRELVSPGHLLGYVANRQSDTVSVLDLDDMLELGAAPVGRDPVDIDGPRSAVVDPVARVLYLVLSYPVVSDSPHVHAHGSTPRAGYLRALALDDLRPLGDVRLAVAPDDVTLSDDGASLAVAHYDTARAIADTTDLDAKRATVAFAAPASGVAASDATLSSVMTCIAPATVVYGPNAARAYVACTGEDSLVVIDTERATVLSRVPAGAGAPNKPYALTRNASGTRLALSNQVAQSVVVFSAGDTPAPVATVRVPGVPYFSAWLGDARLLVPVQSPSGAALVDVTTGTVVASATYADTVCRNPSDARVSADGRLFITCEGDHFREGTVVRIDPQTLAVEAAVTVGVYPDRLAVLEP